MMPPMRAPALFLVIILLAACTGRHAVIPAPTAEEQRLITYLTRDPYLAIVTAVRDQDGYLLLTTRQGDHLARYSLSPEPAGGKALHLHRLVEDLSLDTIEPPQPGTGPEPRRLQR